MNEHIALAIKVLEQHRGDDTARARREFRGLTPDQMSVLHGWRGKTRAEVLAEYESRDAKIDAAIAYLKALQEAQGWMSDTDEVMVMVVLSRQLDDFREQLAEQVRTNQVQAQRIMKLQNDRLVVLGIAEHSLGCLSRTCKVCNVDYQMVIRQLKNDVNPLG